MPHRAENAIKSLETSTAQWGPNARHAQPASERETSSFGGAAAVRILLPGQLASSPPSVMLSCRSRRCTTEN